MSTSCLNTEDYNYLINDQDIITTCQEALLENDLSVPSVCQSDQNTSGSSTSGQSNNKHCTTNNNKKSSPKRNSKGRRQGQNNDDDEAAKNAANASSSGGRKSRHRTKDHDKSAFSSISSSAAKVLVPAGNTITDFTDWLTGIERQLDSICTCSTTGGNGADQKTTTTGVPTVDLEIVKKQKLIQIEIECIGRRFKGLISSQEFGQQESRWHSVWIRSLEFQMMLQQSNRCPNHSNAIMTSTTTTTSSSSSTTTTTTSTGTSTDQPITPINRVKGFVRPLETNHKDIGYSSDAELSDDVKQAAKSGEQLIDPVTAVTMSPVTSCRSSSQGRKRVIKRRQRSRDVKLSPSSSTGCLTLSSKRRPWSFHAATEWTDWDYYQPPSFAVLNADEECSEDENAIRSLIEFGENYENWFRTDDGCVGLRASTPIQDSNEHLIQQRLRPPHHKCDCAHRNAGSETDTGKSSGCCLSEGEESIYSGEELEHDRDSSSLNYIMSPVKRISFMNDASTDCIGHQVTAAADASTITTKVTTCNTSTCTEPVVAVVPESQSKPAPSSRRRFKSISYMIFAAFSVISLFVSIIFNETPPHVQLTFSSPPPV